VSQEKKYNENVYILEYIWRKKIVLKMWYTVGVLVIIMLCLRLQNKINCGQALASNNHIPHLHECAEWPRYFQYC